MNPCDQELCPFWTGDGCACDVLDIPKGQRHSRAFEHTHRSYVDGCFRCELNKDEVNE